MSEIDQHTEARSAKRSVVGLLCAAFASALVSGAVLNYLYVSLRASHLRFQQETAQFQEVTRELTVDVKDIYEQLFAGMGDDFNQTAVQAAAQRIPIYQEHARLVAGNKEFSEHVHRMGENLSLLSEMFTKVLEWEAEFRRIAPEYRLREKTEAARKLCLEISSQLKSLQGKWRIRRAKHLKDLEAKGHVSSQAIQGVRDDLYSPATTALRNAIEEVHEMALGNETLSEASSRDSIINLLENRLRPSFGRLQGFVAELSAPQESAELPGLVENLGAILFGFGAEFDRDHQTVRLGPNSLVQLDLDIVAMERTRGELRRAVQLLLDDWRRDISALTEQLDRYALAANVGFIESLSRGWRIVLVVSCISFAVLLGLGILLSRSINNQLEKLEQARSAAVAASKSKSDFLANMSHELRTPLNSIIGMTDLTLEGQLDAEQRDNLETARDSGKLLLTLIGDILDFSKIEAGKMSLDSAPFILQESVQQCVKMLEPAARAKRIELACSLPEKEEHLMGDANRFKQIIINLLSNAMKFTPAGGGISVHVAEESRSKEGLEVHVVVSDSGIGIPQDKLDKIFQPFTQADGSTTRKYGGTGLGLTICKRFVEMMGGKIWIQSTEGVGSAVHFTARFKPAPAIRAPVITRIAEAVPQSIHILLAEDNAVNQKLAVRLLEKRGFNVQTVENGAEAIAALEAKQFDLLLLDIQMPVMDGLEAARIIRTSNKPYSGIPIIALTANAMTEDRDSYLSAGMNAHVSKPLDSNKLVSEILHWTGPRTPEWRS